MYFCATLDLLQVLKAPLPEHLFERLTVDTAEPDNYRCPLSTDSEMLREYCAALTMLLLQGQPSPQQEELVYPTTTCSFKRYRHRCRGTVITRQRRSVRPDEPGIISLRQLFAANHTERLWRVQRDG